MLNKLNNAITQRWELNLQGNKVMQDFQRIQRKRLLVSPIYGKGDERCVISTTLGYILTGKVHTIQDTETNVTISDKCQLFMVKKMSAAFSPQPWDTS